MTKLYTNTITSRAIELLRTLSTTDRFRSFHLVGGTALSLLLGHRQSEDLDLFTSEEFDTSLVSLIPKTRSHQIISAQPNSIELLMDNTKVHFRFFGYPKYKPILEIQNIRFADPIDIGLMKILALSGRDTKKDIVDLYFIDHEVITIEKLLRIFDDFYPAEDTNSYSSLKSIFDHNTLITQPMPRMLKTVEWDEMYVYVATRMRKFIEDKLKT